jgi:hypothetical protein
MLYLFDRMPGKSLPRNSTGRADPFDCNCTASDKEDAAERKWLFVARAAIALVEELARQARVIEISHRDQA